MATREPGKVHYRHAVARRDISLTDAEQAELLAEARQLQVATNGANGFPHLTTLWFFVDDGLVGFRSFTKSQRIVNLRRDPRITVLAETGTDYQDLRGVMIQGTARLSQDPGEVMRAYAEVTKKNQGTDHVEPGAIDAMFGRFATKNTVVRVDPLKVISWDHRKIEAAY